MKEGDHWQVFVPSELAYGERGAGSKIGPDAVLVRLLPVSRSPYASSLGTRARLWWRMHCTIVARCVCKCCHCCVFVVDIL